MWEKRTIRKACNGDALNDDQVNLPKMDDGMEVLSSLIRSLLGQQEFDLLVATIFDSCKSSIGAGGGCIALLDDGGKGYQVVLQEPLGSSLMVNEIPLAIQGLQEKEYRNGFARYCNDITDKELIDHHFLNGTVVENILSIPLVFDGKTEGILILLNKPGGFTDEDAEIAINFANLMALALKNCQKNESLDFAKDSNERIETEKALEMADRKLNLLGSVTRHDILNQLMIIIGYEGIVEGLIEDQRIAGYLRKMKDAVERINRLLDFQRDYQNMGTEKPTWTRASDIVYLAVSKLDMDSIRLKVNLDGLDLFVDPLVEKVFYNLIHNSLEHGGNLSEISIHMIDEGGNLILVYEDDGKGIPEKNKERIFDYGFGDNTGQGLFLSREILKINNIDIREVGQEGSGVKFEIRIPPTHFIIRGDTPNSSVNA
jgi:signal transduction histidine kinase